MRLYLSLLYIYFPEFILDMQVTAQISLSVFFGVLLQATVLWLIGSRFCASTKEHACPIVQGNLTICKMR